MKGKRDKKWLSREKERERKPRDRTEFSKEDYRRMNAREEQRLSRDGDDDGGEKSMPD